MRRYTLFLPLQMLARYAALSNRSGYKIAELMRQALQKFIDEQDPEGASR